MLWFVLGKKGIHMSLMVCYGLLHSFIIAFSHGTKENHTRVDNECGGAFGTSRAVLFASVSCFINGRCIILRRLLLSTFFLFL